MPINDISLKVIMEDDSIQLFLKNSSKEDLLINDPSAYTYLGIFKNKKKVERNISVLYKTCFDCLDKYKLKAKDSVEFKFAHSIFEGYHIEKEQEYDIFFTYYPSKWNLFNGVGVKSNVIKIYTPSSN